MLWAVNRNIITMTDVIPRAEAVAIADVVFEGQAHL